MIDYFFGKPRTGKTYRAVNILYEDYLKDENVSPKFQNILTNIGGFNFKNVNQLFQDRGSKSVSYKLVWKSFYEHLTVMHKMALDDKDDAELNRYAYSHKINDCLIILDEASLYMKRYDDAISWYLAYHGHFKVRIIIIAQSPKQICAEYLVHAEIYYEAQPQSKQLANGKLRYLHYTDSYFSKDSKFSSDIINSKKEIYDLYKSGEIDKPKKILYKFIFYMFLSMAIMFGLFKFLIYRLSPDIPADENKDTLAAHEVNSYQNNTTSLNTDDILINIRCNDKYCWNPNPKYEKNQVTYSYMYYVVLTNSIELKFSEVTNDVYTSVVHREGISTTSLSKLTDFYYFIPLPIQKSYLSTLFIHKQENNTQKSSFGKINNFMTDEANVQRGAPERRGGGAAE